MVILSLENVFYNSPENSTVALQNRGKVGPAKKNIVNVNNCHLPKGEVTPPPSPGRCVPPQLRRLRHQLALYNGPSLGPVSPIPEFL